MLALGLDMTEHGGSESLGVVLHGPDDEAALRKGGCVARAGRRPGRAEPGSGPPRAARSAGAASGLPAAGPRTARWPTTTPSEGAGRREPGPRPPDHAAEQDVDGQGRDGHRDHDRRRAKRGKPAFLNLGVHHAREWPWRARHGVGHELINGFKAGDARATKIVRNSRNIVVPIVNPDGFEASRGFAGAPDEGRDESVDDTAYLVGGAATGGEYRRKNCRLRTTPKPATARRPRPRRERVDPNRNYGGLWGGPGADPSNPLVQTYRGPGPFSEPETRNIQSLVSSNQVVTLITNHTPPAWCCARRASRRWATRSTRTAATRRWATTWPGTTATSARIVRAIRHDRDDRGLELQHRRRLRLHVRDLLRRPQLRDGDCDDPAFHPLHETMVKEWTGENPQADHVDDPARTPASTARATARRTTSPPRARSTSSDTACSRAAAPPGPSCA